MINTPSSTNIGRFTRTSISTVIGFDFASTVTPFSPESLFDGGKQGVWYDPSDKTTLFQDVAGTVPVTKDGDPVALMRDKSGNGNHATQTASTARPIYKTDGILHWLNFDGADDTMVTADGFIVVTTFVSGMTLSNLRTFLGILNDRVKMILGQFSGGLYTTVINANTPSPLNTNFVSSIITSNPVISRRNSVDFTNQGTTPVASVSSPLLIGSRGDSTWYLNGKIYGIITVDSRMSLGDIAKVEGYLAAKSGVTL